eukprot:gene9774-1974_t
MCSLTAGTRSLYLHWPYCEAICHYCDFNKFKAPKRGDGDGKTPGSDVLALEEAMIRTVSKYFAEERTVPHSVFWGGGTPSLARPSFIKKIHNLFTLPGTAEVTLEVNPSPSAIRSLEAFKDSGVTRLSIGVQSFSSSNLRSLGRIHTPEVAISTIEAAKKSFGPNNVSIDLMYGLPGQSLDHWDYEIDLALKTNVGHLSVYELTFKPNTRFEKLLRAGKLTRGPTEQFYFHASKKIQEHGYSHYEVSNYALPGCEGKHNMHHWQGGEYFGVGPGAISRCTFNGTLGILTPYMNPKEWIRSVESCGHGTFSFHPLSVEEQISYVLETTMRARQGLCLSMFGKRFGKRFVDILLNSSQLRDVIDCGYIQFYNSVDYRQNEQETVCATSATLSCTYCSQETHCTRCVPTAAGMALAEPLAAFLYQSLG